LFFMKASIVTLGCKVNQYESTAMTEMLREAGYEMTIPENVDVVVLNTCAVTGRAESEALSLLRRLRRQNPDAKVVGVGCLAQVNPGKMAGLADLVLGQKEKSALPEHLGLPSGSTLVSPPSLASGDMGDPRPARTRALHKIQDGCDASCAYCAVPMARGPSRSHPPGRVVAGLGRYMDMGVGEVVLTGVHLGLWGRDLGGGLNLSDLLSEMDRYLSNRPDPVRVRLSSLEPLEVPLAAEGLRKYAWLAPHLHSPLQSCSDKILERMRRPYRQARAGEVLTGLRRDIPDLNLGTDLLVGFPGETDEDFEITFEAAAALPLGYMHVFPFSPRPGTRAATLPDQVPPGVKRSRVARLKKLDRRKREAFLASQEGRTRQALVENTPHRSGRRKVLTDNYLAALLPEGVAAAPGEMVEVVLSGPLNEWGLAEARL
jgi:threonylcarbamoyladenosine tRNA methylthiotransferase MtaB